MKNPVLPSSCVTPAGTSNELDVHNEWEENTHIYTCCCLHIKSRSDLCSVLSNIRTGPTDADAFRGHRLTTQKGCVCVCVFFPSILDIKFVGRTSRGHTGGRLHRIFNPPSFCGACLDFCREKVQPFLSLVDREVEFCVLTN